MGLHNSKIRTTQGTAPIAPSAPPAYEDRFPIGHESQPPAYSEFDPLSSTENIKYTFLPTKSYNDVCPNKLTSSHATGSQTHFVGRDHQPRTFTYSPNTFNIGNRYNYNNTKPNKRQNDDPHLSQNKALGFAILISLGTLTLLPYGLRATYKAIKNLLACTRPLNTLWRLYTIAVGITVGWVKGAALGGAIGTALPGLGTATGAALGAILCPLIGAGIGAIIGKYTAKAIAWLNTRNNIDVSTTNHDKWRIPEITKNAIENAQDRHKQTRQDISSFQILSYLRKQKNALGIRAYIPFSTEYHNRTLGNKTLSLMKSGKEPTQNDRFLFWATNPKETALAFDLKTNHWMEGKIIRN